MNHNLFILREIRCISKSITNEEYKGGATEVDIKARGRAISRAIDVIAIVRRRFIQDVKVKEIKIGTEQITSEESNAPINVSTIEITLAK